MEYLEKRLKTITRLAKLGVERLAGRIQDSIANLPYNIDVNELVNEEGARIDGDCQNIAKILDLVDFLEKLEH